jgi:hypothetical protein
MELNVNFFCRIITDSVVETTGVVFLKLNIKGNKRIADFHVIPNGLNTVRSEVFEKKGGLGKRKKLQVSVS